MIQAIETVYNGYRFRSRLEARWAVFFDAAGIQYEYEPQGFKKDGLCYLPDFRVMCYGTRGQVGDKPFPLYIEVKGRMSEKDAEKMRTFSMLGAWDEAIEATRMQLGLLERDYYWNSDLDTVARQHFDKIKHDRISVLLLGDVPNIVYDDDVFDSIVCGCYDSLGYDQYAFNYQSIDDDHFGAYPMVDHEGHFYLMGDESGYEGPSNFPRVAAAYRKARQARFEHGETP